MKLLLDVKCYIIGGRPYHRVHFSTKQARSLDLKKGDKLLIEILEHQRPKLDTLELRTIPLTEVLE